MNRRRFNVVCPLGKPFYEIKNYFYRLSYVFQFRFYINDYWLLVFHWSLWPPPTTDRPPTDPLTHPPNNLIINGPTDKVLFKRLGNKKISTLQNSKTAGIIETILRSISFGLLLMIKCQTLNVCKRKQFFYKRRAEELIKPIF